MKNPELLNLKYYFISRERKYRRLNWILRWNIWRRKRFQTWLSIINEINYLVILASISSSIYLPYTVYCGLRILLPWATGCERKTTWYTDWLPTLYILEIKLVVSSHYFHFLTLLTYRYQSSIVIINTTQLKRVWSWSRIWRKYLVLTSCDCLSIGHLCMLRVHYIHRRYQYRYKTYWFYLITEQQYLSLCFYVSITSFISSLSTSDDYNDTKVS